MLERVGFGGFLGLRELVSWGDYRENDFGRNMVSKLKGERYGEVGS